MTSWAEMRRQDFDADEPLTLFDVDDLMPAPPVLDEVPGLAAELDEMQATTQRLNQLAARRRKGGR